MNSRFVQEIPKGIRAVVEAKRVVDEGIDSIGGWLEAESPYVGHGSGCVTDIPRKVAWSAKPAWCKGERRE